MLGPDGHIMTDFNQGLSLGDALHRCHGLDDQGLYWFEEPIAYDDLAGYARLTRELETPVMLGENFYGPRSLHAAIQAGAGDYVMPDLMRIGGVTGWLRAAALAGAAGHPDVLAPLSRGLERICCASPRPATGWSGRTGRTRSWPSRSRSRTAIC